MKEKLSLTKEQACEILQDNSDEYVIISDEIVGKSRWSISNELVIKRILDNKFFKDIYSVGATEYQDEQPWEYDAPNFTEVFPVEKTIIVYE